MIVAVQYSAVFSVIAGGHTTVFVSHRWIALHSVCQFLLDSITQCLSVIAG